MKGIIKKVLVAIDWIFLKIQGFVISFSKKKYLPFVMRHVCKAAETKSTYVAYQIKPKDTTEIPILSGLEQSHSFAIVLQGPICMKDNMTYNTVKFYKQTYPHAVIIVSTWNDEPAENATRLTEQGAIIVRSEKPAHNGFMNVNYQLTNSLAGVEKAKELGCEFAVKTRTDQRVCKPFIFDAMLSSINMFPSVSEKQRGRVVTLGACGGMFIPYYISDFMYLGYTEDLIKLFSIPYDSRADDTNIKKLGCLSRCQISEQLIPPEVYILKHYCNDVLGLHYGNTLAAYWDVVKKCLICYGMNDIDLMWNKYDDTFYNSSWYVPAYKADSIDSLYSMYLDFFTWLNLYTGNLKYDPCYEKYTNVPFHSNK